MSGGTVCHCKDKDRMKNWVVVHYKCNHSAFNGYKRTPSDYSLLRCRVCCSVWRTKADYVQTVLGNTGPEDPWQ